jgi:hypothetical protein
MASTASDWGRPWRRWWCLPADRARCRSRAGADGAAHLLADEQHRGLVALALADHHRAVDVQIVERGAHRFHGGGIGGLFIAAADQLGGADRRRFGHTHHFKHENAVENLAGRCSGHVFLLLK